jgi:Tfp pilus assembly protein PilX
VTAPNRRERGATLIVTLIMLVVITLFAVSAFNSSNINLKVVGNMQSRAEGMAASQRTIEETVSHTDFYNTPANAIPVPCGNAPNTLCTDLNGDGIYELQSTLTPNPSCNKGVVIKTSNLKITQSADDLACIQAQQQGTFAVAGATPTGDSICADTVWDITAQTLAYGQTATSSDVNVTVTEGVSLRVPAVNLASACPN